MKVVLKFSILSILVLIGLSCSTDQTVQSVDIDRHTVLYQELLGMEYGLLVSDLDAVIDHSGHVDKILRENYNMFCPSEVNGIDAARLSNQVIVQQIKNDNRDRLFDEFRILKGIILRLETDDDSDPYFAFLWRFEEEMDFTTKVAMDPMLDLYEWNEFESMVECMNVAWNPVKMHYPSSEMLNDDPLMYKNQTVYKIYLEAAVEEFQKAVETADYEVHPLCESAERVREAYVQYIYTFVNDPLNNNPFLAKL